MTRLHSIAIACGGTGGHFFPGVAVARHLRDQGHSVTLWLSGREPEDTVKQNWDGPTVIIPAKGMRGFSLTSLRAGASFVSAFLKAHRTMKNQRPDVLLGMGSYAIVGPVLAAAACRIPVVLHEANAIPGRAISLLSRVARCVAITFPDSARHFTGRRTTVTGIPIRALQAGPLPEEPDRGFRRPVILVMGGSQGASFINDTASNALCNLHKRGLSFSVIHLTGPKDRESISSRYQSAGVSAVTLGFLNQMGAAYSHAQLAISRSGASSCMELAAWKIPALYIPLPSARRDHQRLNAVAMASHGAARCLDQHDLTVASLESLLMELIEDPATLDRMKSLIDDSFANDATSRLAELVLKESSHAYL